MEKHYFIDVGSCGATGFNGGTGKALNEEEIKKFEEFLGEALVVNNDIDLPQEIRDNLYIFQKFINTFCKEWTNRQILDNLVIRKIFSLYEWVKFARETNLFWETHEVITFQRAIILSKSPLDERFMLYLSQQNDLTEAEKENFYTSRLSYTGAKGEITNEELIRLGFTGIEYLGRSNKYLNIKYLVIDNIQTTDHVQYFLKRLFNNTLKGLRVGNNGEQFDEKLYFETNYSQALDAISIFSKFNLKVEKPKFWKKMMVLIEDEELKQKLETLTE